MLPYFIVRTAIATLITIALIWLFLAETKRCVRTRCKKPWQIFLPTLLAFALLLQVLISSAPKWLDSVDITRGTTPFRQVIISNRQSLLGKIKTDDGKVYTYSPFLKRPEVGVRYNISYVPYSHYIIRIEKAEN